MKSFRNVSIRLRDLLLAAVVMGAVGQSIAQPAGQAPSPLAKRGDVVPGKYIVVFTKGAPGSWSADVLQGGGTLHHSYSRAMHGFLASLSPSDLEKVRRHPLVAYVEEDRIVTSIDIQSGPVWNLDRIDQTNLLLDGFYSFDRKGTGAYAFVVDTGIYPEHPDFNGRALPGVSYVPFEPPVDFNGHGTHAAGTIGSSTYGVAKQVALVPVKVLNRFGQGRLSDVLLGLDWIASQAQLRPAVVNMSLAGPFSQAVNDAVGGLVAGGVPVVVAAGNNSEDACAGSPASAPEAIVVGATGRDDTRAWFSNYGKCLTLFAPGVDVLSTWIPVPPQGSTAFSFDFPVVSDTGTSMAAPHVTGQVATLLQAFPQATPLWIRNNLVISASVDRLGDVGIGSPNRLLYTRAPVYGASVNSLNGRAVGAKNKWAATVNVSVYDAALTLPIGGARVEGTFLPGGLASCVTTSTGNCSITAADLPRTTRLTTFTVQSISGWNLAYKSTLNAATQVKVLKPEE